MSNNNKIQDIWEAFKVLKGPTKPQNNNSWANKINQHELIVSKICSLWIKDLSTITNFEVESNDYRKQ